MRQVAHPRTFEIPRETERTLCSLFQLRDIAKHLELVTLAT